MGYEDAEEQKDRAAAASSERRDVWVACVVAQLESGRHPQEAASGAGIVLDAFDEKFPGLVRAIIEHNSGLDDEEPE